MILSLGLVLILGFIGGVIFEKIKLPKIIGMIIIGILLGSFSILDESLLFISPYLRQIALIIILTKAGLSIDIKQLKEVGRPAILMCFLPALFEIVGTVIFAPLILNIDYLEALLLGTVLAAVSPAIIVPRMIKCKEEYKSNIPNLLLASSSLDDIFVIVLFYSTLGLFNNSNSFSILYELPLSIVLGVIIGVVIGLILNKLFTKESKSLIIITLGISLLLIGLETYINYSSLISIIILGIFLSKNINKEIIKEEYNFLWKIFEIILFVLVGVSVDVTLAFDYGLQAILLLIIILLFRTLGVFICLIKSNILFKEKIFCVISYLPKATVQASIGAIPLTANIEIGGLILSIAVLSIIITAPLGAILIDNLSYNLLENKECQNIQKNVT